jgi:hypothetical protein
VWLLLGAFYGMQVTNLYGGGNNVGRIVGPPLRLGRGGGSKLRFYALVQSDNMEVTMWKLTC